MHVKKAVDTLLLSPREKGVSHLLARSHSNSEIAQLLYVFLHTIKFHEIFSMSLIVLLIMPIAIANAQSGGDENKSLQNGDSVSIPENSSPSATEEAKPQSGDTVSPPKISEPVSVEQKPQSGSTIVSPVSSQPEKPINEKAGKTTPDRRKLFWTAVGIGAASSMGAIYLQGEADRNYKSYQDAKTEEQGNTYKSNTQDNDNYTNIALGIAAVSFGTAIYLFVADREQSSNQYSATSPKVLITSDGKENIGLMVEIDPESLEKQIRHWQKR